MSGSGDDGRLLVRGFPHWLRASEKTSLLQHFGATEVTVLPTRGKMKNCVFATFTSQEDAKRAVGKLHQLQVLGSRLVVEFAHSRHSHLLQGQSHDIGTEEHEDSPPSPKPAATRSLPPPPPPPPPAPRLCYHYPPPSPSTLTNITHTLATIPKFYEQVLHLMNLMNLPPPFGPVTPAPPGLEVRGGGGVGEGEEGESEAESEIGSDGGRDSGPEREVVVREVKRRVAHLAPSRGVSPPAKRRPSHPQFDSSSPLVPVGKKISLQMPSKIEPRPPDHSNVISMTTISAISQSQAERCQEERKLEEEKGEEDEEGEMGEGEKFITSEELSQNRLSDREMQEMSVFRGYSSGEPSLRLYIKNLSRQATEQDLRYVYGRYVNWSDERERTVFDVRLMQTGRMKGQAFIGLPSEEAATRALRETNGLQLAGKPVVVHFARTAKAKPSQL